MLRRQVVVVAAVVVLVVIAAVLLLSRGSSPSPAPSATTALASEAPSSAAASSPAASASASAAPSETASGSVEPTDAASEPASAPPSDEAPSVAPTNVAVDLPDTPIVAPLDEGYDTSGEPFDPANLGGLEPGDVNARWYVEGDVWVVHYEGLDLEATGPLCPGNSIQAPSSSFEHVSNAPTGEDGDPCGLFQTTLAEPPAGVRLCEDQVLYLTEIPADAEGILFASLERTTDDGAFVGLTGDADPTAGEAPEIDLEALGCEVVPPRP